MSPLARLRARARCATLFPPGSLGAAMDRLGFVQADPIRAPARAQDLILRHRVTGYRAGDLQRGFARLGLEEDFLHAYGFMPPATRTLLHPRPPPPGGMDPLAAAVLDHVRAAGPTHPAALAAAFGRARAVNAWGGFSKATTGALEQLRHHGLLRVAARQDGIRIYQATPLPILAPEDAAARALALVLLVARILAPVSPTTLRAALALMARQNPDLGPLAPVLASLRRGGALEPEVVEGETYLAPPGASPEPDSTRTVRFLAPFDPLVWDRRRFGHLWGWRYRFEAYTPPGRRQFGYYALPLLWGDVVIGWVNAARVPGGGVAVQAGFAAAPPRSVAFRRAFDAEVARLERFLGERPCAGRVDRAGARPDAGAASGEDTS